MAECAYVDNLADTLGVYVASSGTFLPLSAGRNLNVVDVGVPTTVHSWLAQILDESVYPLTVIRWPFMIRITEVSACVTVASTLAIPPTSPTTTMLVMAKSKRISALAPELET